MDGQTLPQNIIKAAIRVGLFGYVSYAVCIDIVYILFLLTEHTRDQGAEFGRGEAQAKALAYEIAAERAYYEFRRMNGQ